jgi:hypothetical protein
VRPLSFTKSKYWRNNLVEAFPFGISKQICFFSDVGLSDQCPQPSLTEGKNSKHYPGIEPSTFGVTVGDANHYTI